MNINDKSIEELENDYWEDSDFNSYIVLTTQNARKKPVSQLSDEEIRLLIGQKIGLKYLIPIALSLISKDPLVEVTFYKGDLLSQLLKLSYNDWEQNEEDLKYFQKIVNDNLTLIQSCDEISNDLIAKYLEGKKKNKFYSVTWIVVVREGAKAIQQDKERHLLFLLSYVRDHYDTLMQFDYCEESIQLVDVYIHNEMQKQGDLL